MQLQQQFSAFLGAIQTQKEFRADAKLLSIRNTW
jgi:hypothetical protein